MADIIRFPHAPTPYPESVTKLDPAESILLVATRWWVDDLLADRNPMPRLCQGLEMGRVREAAAPIDAAMTIVARTARQRISIHHPRCHRLSSDEQLLLHAASRSQAGDSELAEKALRDALLSAEGAGLLLTPLLEIGVLFAGVRLLFRPRPAPLQGVSPQTDAWGIGSETLH